MIALLFLVDARDAEQGRSAVRQHLFTLRSVGVRIHYWQLIPNVSCERSVARCCVALEK